MIDEKLINRENWEEHYVRRGDPTKPTYYIIRHKYSSSGLFAWFNLVGGHIRYALPKGWLPVVDMQNYPNPYLAPEKFGKENSWEYYFEQPLRINLEEAYEGENVILSSGSSLSFMPWNGNLYENNIFSAEWKMLVKLGLLCVKEKLNKEIMMIREKWFPLNERILGVCLRGTDYVSKKPYGHSIPPPIELVSSTAFKKLREWKCNKMFLATEDKNIVDIFKNVFGDLCIVSDRKYVDYIPGDSVSNIRIDRENDHFLQGKDYLTQIVILSTCNSIVASRCGGLTGAMMLAKNFENIFVFNLGNYGVYK